MKALSSAVAIALICVSIQGARAQQMPPGVTAAECDKLAGMPNAPISVETCRAMFGMATSLDAAVNDPRARRPGDQGLSCTQLFDELKTMADVGISQATSAQMADSRKKSEAAGALAVADMTSFMAETAALGAAMTPMGPYVPNFVSTAIVAAWQARAMGMIGRQQAAMATQRTPRILPRVIRARRCATTRYPRRGSNSAGRTSSTSVSTRTRRANSTMKRCRSMVRSSRTSARCAGRTSAR